jgi:hypothetical protein
VVRVGVLVDLQRALHLEVDVGQEGPPGAGGHLELEGVVQVVGQDRDHGGVGDRDQLLEAEQLDLMLPLARAVLAAPELEHHRVAALRVRKPVQHTRLVGQPEHPRT